MRSSTLHLMNAWEPMSRSVTQSRCDGGCAAVDGDYGGEISAIDCNLASNESGAVIWEQRRGHDSGVDRRGDSQYLEEVVSWRV